jgi:hypothetical protein
MKNIARVKSVINKPPEKVFEAWTTVKMLVAPCNAVRLYVISPA